MSEYTASTNIHASADQLFQYMSQPENMRQYLPTIQEAEPTEGEHIHIVGDSPGGHYDVEGHFHVDEAARRMEWGADGQNRYSGWMKVEGDDLESKVTVHLSFDPLPDQEAKFEAISGDRDKAIHNGLEETLRAIKAIVEGNRTMVDVQNRAELR